MTFSFRLVSAGLVKQKQQTKKGPSAPLMPTLKAEAMDIDTKDPAERIPKVGVLCDSARSGVAVSRCRGVAVQRADS